MDSLLLFRPSKPTPAHAAAASTDSDLPELDAVSPASSSSSLLSALPDEEGKKKKKRSGRTVRFAALPVPETAALTPLAVARSAPVQIPPEAPARRGTWSQAVGGEDGDAIVPPHEIVARRAGAHSSVLEGAGRTLKGRDLHRVRNAVLRRTGFLD